MPVVPTAVPTQPPAAAPTTAQAAGKPLKIAILLSTTSADSGWDATAYQGGQDAKAQLGAEVSVNENTVQSSAEAVVRDYASRGYNLIVVNDFGLGDVACKIAPDYPNVNFAITTGIWEAPNVS